MRLERLAMWVNARAASVIIDTNSLPVMNCTSSCFQLLNHVCFLFGTEIWPISGKRATHTGIFVMGAWHDEGVG